MKRQEESRNFIDEPIEIGYRIEPLLKKVPVCPDFFIWRGDRFQIRQLVFEWCDLARSGNASRNMRPSHLLIAEKMGSWGVGRFFYQVIVQDGREFVIYYDRAPSKGAKSFGHWILLYENL